MSESNTSSANADKIDGLGSQVFSNVDVGAKDNFIMSPVGAWLVVAMLQAGATGKTETELAALTGLEGDEVSATASQVMSQLDDLVGLGHAAALWSQDPVVAEFAGAFPTILFASMGDADLDAWVAEHTLGLIKKFPAEPSEDTRAIVADAFGAKLAWNKQFSKSATTPGPFVCSDGSSLDVNFMKLLDSEPLFQSDTQTTLRKYLHAEDTQTAASSYYLDLILPNDKLGMAELIDVVTRPTDEATLRTDAEAALELPKYGFDFKVSLNTPLSKAGAARMFTDASEITKIVTAPLTIEQFAQSSMIRVDELGLETASVTAAMARLGAMPQQKERITLRFDRPFGFRLCVKETHLPLVVGAVGRPDPV